MTRWRARPRRCRRFRPRVRRLERRTAQAPALIEPAVKALDAALNALEEARGHLERALARRRSRSARTGTHRGAAVRAARRRPQIQCAGRWSRRARRALCRRSGADRCRRRTAGGAGKRARRGRARSLRHGRRRRCRASARRRPRKLDKAVNAELKPLKLERAKFSTEIETEPEPPARTASTASNSGCRPIPARGRAR